MEPLELIAHLQPQLGVQVGKRFVHKQHRGLRCQGAGNGHPLLLPTGQLRRIAVHKHADLHDSGHPAHRQVDLFPGEFAGLRDHLSVPQNLEVLIQGLVFPGRVRLGL